jgi:prepilin-type N-terminal cleavage/methylation domain-containing protein
MTSLKEMGTQRVLNKQGVSLIELLVALVICGIVVAGSYRFFITQNKVYVVQDQVIEAQQNVRLAMEILLRDLRMAGYDDDNNNSTITITDPIVGPLRDDSITFSFEYYDKTTSQYQKHTVAYRREMNPSRLIRQLTINDVAGPPDVLLENVDDFKLTYGINTNGDGEMTQWVPADKVGVNKVMAVHVVLSATPPPVNPDARMVSPRTLASAVTLRNLSMVR